MNGIQARILYALLERVYSTIDIREQVFDDLDSVRRNVVIMFHMKLIRPVGYDLSMGKVPLIDRIFWELTEHAKGHYTHHPHCMGCLIRERRILRLTEASGRL